MHYGLHLFLEIALRIVTYHVKVPDLELALTSSEVDDVATVGDPVSGTKECDVAVAADRHRIGVL